MSAQEIQSLINGGLELAAIGAVWSLLFFGKVRLSSPAASRPARQPKRDVDAEPAPKTPETGAELRRAA